MSNLLKDNEVLMSEYNFKKNKEIDLDKLTLGAEKKVWWKCSACGHEWEAMLYNRFKRGTGCPVCALKKMGINHTKNIINKKGSLYDNRSDLLEEWNNEKNYPLTPRDVTEGSHKKVWWKCDKGHEWEADIRSRCKGSGCPFCSGRNVIVGNNDLATINSTLTQEWNYEKNGDLKPSMVKANTVKKVWWKCKKGHEWEASIASRNRGTGCPICASELQTSFPEQAIFYYFKQIFPDAISRDHHLEMELDIFIPSQKIAIEYDGSYWHKNKKREERKNQLCEDNKIVLFRIKEDYKGKNIDNEYLKIISCSYSDSGIKSAIEIIAKYLNKCVDVNINRDRILIYTSYINNEKEHSLMILNPTLAQEWNYEKNGDLKPDMIALNSGKKVWWICEKGHEWEASLYSRNNGSDCPICASIKILSGYNDLETINPTLAQEWNYEKNGDLKPSMVASNANKKVWWICEKGHEWEASISNRSKERGCPICANKQILVGYNDLATTNPILVKEWDYKKNYPLTPNDVTSGSDKKVWWICEKGHKWEACVANRVIGTGCPICASKIIQKGYNDLVTTNPTLAQEWNYEKNGDLKPSMVASNANKKVWWICEKGHEWEADISNRHNNRGCPVCANKQLLVGYNDLATTNPILAKEWNYDKNYPLTPNDTIAGSSKKVWWICEKGHEWEATTLNRVNGRGCPICAGKIIQKGYNDLVTTNPTLAKEWNYEKNYPLTPNDVTSGSNKKVWWVCEKKHEWEACISNRNNGNKCPVCAGQQVLKGYNDLATVNPNLAQEWNYQKNEKLNPTMVMANSGKKVWWKCSRGHEWQAVISSRNRGAGCPKCYKINRK